MRLARRPEGAACCFVWAHPIGLFWHCLAGGFFELKFRSLIEFASQIIR
jgi:hypothetical protein